LEEPEGGDPGGEEYDRGRGAGDEGHGSADPAEERHEEGGPGGTGTRVNGDGQFDFDPIIGMITNGTASFSWAKGFQLAMTFQGQAPPDGTFTGTWAGDGLSGTFAETTDFMTGAHVRFDSTP
jgi:hypothetical protein